MFAIWSSDTKKRPKLYYRYFPSDAWLTHPSSKQVITLFDIFFLITDVKLLSNRFYSLSPRMLRRCVFFKMKDVLCISAELAFKFPLLGMGDGGRVKDFKYENYCMSCKQKRKDDRLNSKWSKFRIQPNPYTLICSANQWTGFYMITAPRHERVNILYTPCNFQNTLIAVKR